MVWENVGWAGDRKKLGSYSRCESGNLHAMRNVLQQGFGMGTGNDAPTCPLWFKTCQRMQPSIQLPQK